MKELFPMVSSLAAWNWLILAATLLALETVIPGFFLLWFGLAAIAVGIIAFTTDLSWQWELLIFGIFSIAAVVIVRKYFRPQAGDTDKPHLNRRADQYVGKTFVLASAIVNGQGKVRIGDSLWSVTGPDLPEGSKVVITGSQGTMLTSSAAPTEKVADRADTSSSPEAV